MMEDARILFYNSQDGQGKLIFKSGEKIDFSADTWDDFGSMPETGMLVKYSMENGVIKSLKALHLNIPLADNDSKEPEVLSIKKEGSTYSVSETLNNYFSSVENAIGEPPEIVNTKAQLDYFLSRRFLLTAYNNLKGLDPTLHDHKKIKEQLKILQNLHNAYYTVTQRVDIPHLAFEMIFLRSQPEYLNYISDKERCHDGISILSKLVNSLIPAIQKEEDELKKMTNNKIRTELEDKLKKHRGSYVDAVHEKACLNEELAAIEDIKTIYTKKYFDSFKSELSQLQVQYKKMLSKILSYKAYELDNLIWKQAGTSKPIQEYFRDSGIKGDYSTKTFLRYYLNTLDKEILNEEQEELFKLLNYLE